MDAVYVHVARSIANPSIYAAYVAQKVDQSIDRQTDLSLRLPVFAATAEATASQAPGLLAIPILQYRTHLVLHACVAGRTRL